MKTYEINRENKFCLNLYNHAKTQHIDMAILVAAYAENGQVFGVDYINKEGRLSRCSGTASADTKYLFVTIYK
jgi:hypothetical protein